LPRKGYKCKTVRDKLHEEIRKKSKETTLNVKENIEYLMKKEKSLQTGNQILFIKILQNNDRVAEIVFL
jgi:hypothetical protein